MAPKKWLRYSRGYSLAERLLLHPLAQRGLQMVYSGAQAFVCHLLRKKIPDISIYQSHRFTDHTIFGLSDLDLVFVIQPSSQQQYLEQVQLIHQTLKSFRIFDADNLALIPDQTRLPMLARGLYCHQKFPPEDWQHLSGTQAFTGTPESPPTAPRDESILRLKTCRRHLNRYERLPSLKFLRSSISVLHKAFPNLSLSTDGLTETFLYNLGRLGSQKKDLSFTIHRKPELLRRYGDILERLEPVTHLLREVIVTEDIFLQSSSLLQETRIYLVLTEPSAYAELNHRLADMPVNIGDKLLVYLICLERNSDDILYSNEPNLSRLEEMFVSTTCWLNEELHIPYRNYAPFPLEENFIVEKMPALARGSQYCSQVVKELARLSFYVPETSTVLRPHLRALETSPVDQLFRQHPSYHEINRILYSLLVRRTTPTRTGAR